MEIHSQKEKRGEQMKDFVDFTSIQTDHIEYWVWKTCLKLKCLLVGLSPSPKSQLKRRKLHLRAKPNIPSNQNIINQLL